MYYAQNEKRSFHRMEINLPIEIHKGGFSYQGTCNDLSSTGMRITFNDTGLCTDDHVEILLDTKDNRFLPLHAVAKLLRVTEGEQGGFSAAVEFVELK
ncbi:PilZ domain-containing protein [Psychromonas sp. 14N.309.X.WAT.B.A12]|uniref:PilZ domain-containing protein n=1 Tax=unclassified Psychromonas TaxID=2614957 RepID=UPI0025AF4206|nr:PilZ domain-containing protein [Psychromonas sp. 14N.309.X.WAT.B.A12]MDN2662035.1 PilZ domain-containing protein [Psychromonas sp. 14N.309.X.WAT.B.A12]